MHDSTSDTPRSAAAREWEEIHGTRTSLLNALTRIENHIKAGKPEAALKTIERARATAARNGVRDAAARRRA